MAIQLKLTGHAPQQLGLRQSGGMTIYHIARVPDWTDAQREGEYRVSTSGMSLDEVGYIHASTAAQVVPTAERFYQDETVPLCVLAIDESAVQHSGTEIREESGDDGQWYPHIYGPLDPEWVITVHPGEFGTDGRFVW
ncbi:DUF952 domain-containing protein [Corynebacterium sp. CNJ-954]|uniref:DUF952 domain-containing protein n=1 Tax=Corynebacterium sp. CNJ-954 TaxID=1904962 RepID=UPI0021009A84|nr:DUF952 domain-containing protein [Corynebacterium sp. CNJ-954]